MTCREFTDFIADYFAGELDESARATFDRHLSRCPNCRRYLADYDASVKLGKAAFEDADASVPPELPDGLIEAILAARRRS